MEYSIATHSDDPLYEWEWYDIVVMQILLLYHHKKIIILCHICKLMLLFVKLKKYFTFYVFFYAHRKKWGKNNKNWWWTKNIWKIRSISFNEELMLFALCFLFHKTNKKYKIKKNLTFNNFIFHVISFSHYC